MASNDGKVTGLEKIVDNGADDQRWTLVILSDGYQEGQLPQFKTDAQNFVDMLKKTAPFHELWSGINVYRVDVASTESGADGEGPDSPPKATFFDAAFGTGDNAVVLIVNDFSRNDNPSSVAQSKIPQTDHVVVIVNSQNYGGSGRSGRSTVFSLGRDDAGNDAALTGIHELGH